jgi:hypothetical protein
MSSQKTQAANMPGGRDPILRVTVAAPPDTAAFQVKRRVTSADFSPAERSVAPGTTALR